MGKLTTHVLNIATGAPAAGMRIDLRALPEGSAEPPSASRTNEDGRCSAPLLEGAALRIGRYSLTFHVAAYFRSLGVALTEPPFLDEVVIAFGVADPNQNYHVPLLVSPWSYSTYRGS
jgi:5-hydroxyisourate hydrolase